MALLTKPNMNNIWASGGDIVEPTDLKKQQGWTAEVPPFQYENWIQNRQDEYLAHINQRGIPAWDALTEYEAGGLSYVQGSDGKIYKSVAASGPTTTIQDPKTDATDTYWTVAFADTGAFLTPAEGDVRYAKVASNLSDLTNVATARTNLSVYSKLESDGLYLAKAQNLADLTNTTTARTNLGAAPIVSPTFTGTPTAPTAPQFDNDTSIATTEFVQRALGNYQGVVPIVASGPLSVANAGKFHFFPSASSSFNVTLPALSGLPKGAAYHFYNNSPYSHTLTVSGSDLIGSGQIAIGTTYVIPPGCSATLTRVDATGWFVSAGTSSLDQTAVFASFLNPNGYQKLPSGLIIQWGTTGAGTSVAVTFPIAFPTAAGAVTANSASTGGFAIVHVLSVTTTGCTIAAQSSTTGGPYKWIAVGY